MSDPDADPTAENSSTDTTVTAEDRWIDESRILDAELPNDVGESLGQFLGGQSVSTLGEWVAGMKPRVGGGDIEIEDLCHADGETAHRATADGETYHFQCFYDAVVLAALREGPVDIRTESPEGRTVEARAVGTEKLTVTPEEAVFSFGVDRAVDPPDGDELDVADVYPAVCPYVRAFPDRSAYEEWAESTPAATVGTELAGATDIAAAIVE